MLVGCRKLTSSPLQSARTPATLCAYVVQLGLALPLRNLKGWYVYGVTTISSVFMDGDLLQFQRLHENIS